MAGLKSALLFLLQSIVAGLAVAFVVVLIRPDLLPSVGAPQGKPPASYADAVDAILLWNGEVTEGAVSSVLIVENGAIVRRPHGNEVLPGTTTDFVVDVARAAGLVVHEEIIDEQRLRGADEIWLTGATKGIAPVTRLDGEPVGTGEVGPVWQRVVREFEQKLHE